MNSDSNKKTDLQQNPPANFAAGQPNQDEQVLVAYLDGELNEQETAEIESRLAMEQPLRTQLHALQQTWDMLDELPAVQASGEFVKSTIEMLVTQADTTRRKWHRWPIRMALLTGTFGLAMLVATQLIHSIQTRPYRQFVQDLDFIEKIDVLDEVESIEFLEELHREGVFDSAFIAEEVSSATN